MRQTSPAAPPSSLLAEQRDVEGRFGVGFLFALGSVLPQRGALGVDAQPSAEAVAIPE